MKLKGIEFTLVEACAACEVGYDHIRVSAKKQNMTVEEYLQGKFNLEKYLEKEKGKKARRKFYYGV